MRQGGRGVISAMANVHPGALARLHAGWRSGDATAMQARIDAARKMMGPPRLISSMKALVAQWRRDPEWACVRPPLVSVPEETGRRLAAEWASAGYDVPEGAHA